MLFWLLQNSRGNNKVLAMAVKFNFRILRQLKVLLWAAFFIIILAISISIMALLLSMSKEMKDRVLLEADKVHENSFSKIQMTAALLYYLNSSATELARALSSYLDGTQLSFSEIESKVAPTLFLALSATRQVSQISYIGLDGLMFSFYDDDDKTLAVYSNSSSYYSSWYTKPVNRDTGKLFGDAVACNSMITANESWIEKAKNSTNGYSSLGTAWNKDRDSLFVNTAPMDGRGVISLGYPKTIVTSHFKALDFHGGYFYLGTMHDGQMIMQTMPPDIRVNLHYGSVMVQVFNPNSQITAQENLSWIYEDDDRESGLLRRKIVANKYIVYCSDINIAGVPSVYVMVYHKNGMVKLVEKNIKFSTMLLAVVFVFFFCSLLVYIYMTIKAAKREMFLCAALIKQTEATQQAERKSMNKTKAYAGANHDVRGSLAAITGLIELCQDEVKPGSELATNLDQMQKCTRDLLEILNSVLDMSKLEAGKTSLEIEEFNLAQLLEDVVGMYYPLGVKNGVDIVLDPCDALKLPDVRGDRLKLKQILCNLLSNAIKFTSAGHVSVRAMVKKKNIENEIIASSTTFLKFFPWLRCWHKDTCTDLDAFHTVKGNPSETEFEFEVDDTGQGIPRDKQTSIFEDYVQVKETAIGHEGCGLGLGIVQSLVRVMKGELKIVEKEPGERGTCFRFNVFLSVSESEYASTEENQPSGFHQHFLFISPKPEGSHMILFITGDERRRVLKKYIESLNIKVTVIKHETSFCSELDIIKHRMDVSYLNSGKLESSSVDNLSASTSSNPDPEANIKAIIMKEGVDPNLPQYKKTNSESSSGIILFVIDSNAASSCPEFVTALASFRKDIIKSACKVLWLDDQVTCPERSQEQDQRILEGDYVIYKPFHGSRLSQVMSLLPERKGAPQCTLSKYMTGPSMPEVCTSVDFYLSNASSSPRFDIDLSAHQPSSIQTSKYMTGPSMPEVCTSVDLNLSNASSSSRFDINLSAHQPSSIQTSKYMTGPSMPEVCTSVDLNLSNASSSSRFDIDLSAHQPSSIQTIAMNEPDEEIQTEKPLEGEKVLIVEDVEFKPLKGKKVLVVEDVQLLRFLVTVRLCKLGAHVETCTDGDQAVNRVCKALSDKKTEGDSKSLPYDYIFMDCQMPVMNGYEATRLIRIEEKCYDVHIPIIALTAHALTEEASMSIDAGMDFHLNKPLDVDKLLDVIKSIGN
ncbi:histidine kinase CKI1-like isoform X2 [Mercurialis annua]|uniref:histidine kinase CKI1-like isoform X2 n=1 Tax=Mercurialis annua TaxID=3986 RepID=UPI00215F3A7C|nr:histidine kinase CKI1-like isoform X2 [Mercurialis annua]